MLMGAIVVLFYSSLNISASTSFQFVKWIFASCLLVNFLCTLSLSLIVFLNLAAGWGVYLPFLVGAEIKYSKQGIWMITILNSQLLYG